MMSQINRYIKNITKIKLLIFLIFYANTLYAQNSSKIKNKKQSLNNIDFEIQELENQLELEINSQTNAIEKSKKIEQEILKQRTNLLNNRDNKESKEKLLIRAQFILDSLNTSLQNTKVNKNQVNQTINKIKKEKKQIKGQLNNLNANIYSIDQSIESTQNKLFSIKKDIQNMIIETIVINNPTDIQFLLESNTWSTFIINSTLYKLLIDTEKKEFENLIEKQKKLNKKYTKDSVMKIDLLNQTSKLIDREKNYQMQLENFNAYQNILDDLINDKTIFFDNLMSEYQNIGLQLDKAKKNIISLEEELNKISTVNKESLESQKKIQSQLEIKKEARTIIRNEIYKLIETEKVFEGINIKKLKGKLPWPMEGKIITKFGKHINPNTNVVINYELIEIMPFMTNKQKSVYYAKQINPSNPNKKIVQKFQEYAMNIKQGDRGFGVFGPQTTKAWKKYNKINENVEKEPIYAIHNGVVESISFINPIVGVVVIIRHDNEYFSVYNGNIEMLVLENTMVKSGMEIGTINKQNILSFQLWKNKTPIDPEKWLIKK